GKRAEETRRTRDNKRRSRDDPSCHVRPHEGLKATRSASANSPRMSTTASRPLARSRTFPFPVRSPIPRWSPLQSESKKPLRESTQTWAYWTEDLPRQLNRPQMKFYRAACEISS